MNKTIDFAPELLCDELHDHVFLILSLEGCEDCDRLYNDIHDAYDLISREPRRTGAPAISIVIHKLDVTCEGRSDKPKFVERLVREYQYKPRKDGRVIFPICVYNNKYIGQYKEGYGTFCSVVEEYL